MGCIFVDCGMKMQRAGNRGDRFFVSLINGANFVGSKYENIIIDMVSESVSILKDFL